MRVRARRRVQGGALGIIGVFSVNSNFYLFFAASYRMLMCFLYRRIQQSILLSSMLTGQTATLR